MAGWWSRVRNGGRYCGYLAAKAGLLGVVLNDAAVGRDEAGIGSLAVLAPLGIPAATVAHDSARIGDAEDMCARGRISPLERAGAPPRLRAGADLRRGGAADGGPPRAGRSARGSRPARRQGSSSVRRGAGVPAVVGCDSASLVRPEDVHHIVVTGSHCGALPGRPGYGLGVRARGAVFNDAGGGAGIARLPVLDAQGIPGAAVAAASARIGEARSTWETGIISAVNELAASRGARAGMTVPEFADRLG